MPAPASVSAPAGRDALAAIIPALAAPAYAYLKALPIWRREDGLLPSRRWLEWPVAATVSGLPWCRDACRRTGNWEAVIRAAGAASALPGVVS